MNNYSIDTDERKLFYFTFAFISLFFIPIIKKILQWLEIDQVAFVPSTFVVFGFLLAVHNKFTWKLASKLGLSEIPNLNGEWVGCLKRPDEEFSVKLGVTQNWEKMDFVLDSNLTTGETVTAAFLIKNTKNKRIKYTYLVKRRNYVITNEYNPYGEGTSEFRYLKKPDGEYLEGYYYSNKLRGGEIILRKVSPKNIEKSLSLEEGTSKLNKPK